MGRTVILAGIDEAGYGPLLGPLVVSAAAFEMPAEAVEQSLWKLLKKSVTDKNSVRDKRIAVMDSKRLFQREEGLGRLERGVLSVLHAGGEMPRSIAALVYRVAPAAVEPLRTYPWYEYADSALPTACDEGALRIAGARLQGDLAGCGGRVAGVWSEILPEGHYNRMVRGTDNKAIVLFGLTLRLVQRIADAYPRHDIIFAIDKQGGRDSYARPLLQAFDGRKLRIIDEGGQFSAYELRGPTTWRVSFSQEGESKHMATALASMVSKYLRELCMGCFNGWWARQVPDIAPTAGYYTDGQRFVSQIAAHLPRLGIERELLIRSR